MKLPSIYRPQILPDRTDVGTQRTGIRVGDHQDFDQMAVLIREKTRAQFWTEKDNKEIPFRICRRLAHLKGNVVPSDAVSECAMCKIPVVYDREHTMDKTPKVCLPCADRLLQNGMRELVALGSYSPQHQDLDDDTMLARLHANVFENKRGAVDPKHVFQGKKELPEHELRRKGQEKPKERK